jgi:anti-anti-sigma factor
MKEADIHEVWDFKFEHAWIFVVRGDLDIHLSMDLRDRLERALAASPGAILVDLEETSFMDSCAVEVLLAARDKAQAAGAVLRLVAPSAPARRLLNLTRTESLFSIDSDLVTAYAPADGRTDPKKAAGFDDAA